MANSISVRSAQFVQFVLDTNAAGGTAPKLTLLCNREYAVVDYAIITTAQAGGDAVLTIKAFDTASPPASTTLGLLTGAIAAGTWTRPTTTNTLNNASLLASAAVIRGGTLSLEATTAGDFTQGYLAILPGSRYSATIAPVYYANNATTGAQGSSAVQSI